MAGITAISRTNTELLREKYDKITQRLAEMTEITATTCRTSGNFTYSPNSSNSARVEISKATDITGLIMITGFINTKHKEYQEAVKLLGLQASPVFLWLGYKAEDWIHDLKLRIAVLTQVEERKLLEGYATELSKYFSDDDRFEQLMAKLAMIP